MLSGVFTSVIISLSIIYYHQFAWSKQVKPALVFWTGVIASYIVSIFVWLSMASPSAGTSIIGFCVVGFLLFSSLSDLRIYFNTKRIEQGKLIIAKVFFTASITVISLFFAFFFYSLSSSVYVHFGGGAIAAILILITIKTKIWQIAREKYWIITFQGSSFFLSFFGFFGRDFGNPERWFTDNPQDIFPFIEQLRRKQATSFCERPFPCLKSLTLKVG